MNDKVNKNPMNTNESNEQQNQPIVGLPGDERDVLISRVIDGVATSADWTTFRSIAAHDPSIWTELADTQQIHESVCAHVESSISFADRVELPGGVMNDQPLHARMEVVSRWGGWAAAAAILLVWFFGGSLSLDQTNDSPATAGILNPNFINSKPLLDDAQPDQAFDQYLSSGRSSGQVVGEMPEHVVIETRPMPDGTIEVLYLRQIIERQIIDHAYREMRDETGNVFPVPVKLAPRSKSSF